MMLRMTTLKVWKITTSQPFTYTGRLHTRYSFVIPKHLQIETLQAAQLWFERRKCCWIYFPGT